MLGVSLITPALPSHTPSPAFHLYRAGSGLPEISPLTHRLGMEDRPYSSRLKKIGALLEQDSVTREEVVSELGG